MANRSYLYAIDFDRIQGERQAGDKIYGLAKCGYDIPLAYKILVSQNARLSHSIIWDYPRPIAIQGEFEAGREKLFAFLNQLAAEKIFDSVELQRQIRATEAFLEKNRLRYAILECGEIYELEQTALEVQNQELFEREILNIDSHLAGCLAELGEMKREAEQLEAAAQQPPPSDEKLFLSPVRSPRENANGAARPRSQSNQVGHVGSARHQCMEQHSLLPF